MQPKLSILYVDDSMPQLSAVKSRLEKEGHAVMTCLSAKEAFNRLLIGRYDLCIVDYNMPGQNGSELVAQVKKSNLPADTAFYLYTTDLDAFKKSAGLGFDGAFILKGNLESLVTQMDPIARKIQLRKLAPKV